MKNMVIMTATEGGCDREDVSETDIAKMKEEINKEKIYHNENLDCICNSCIKVRIFESMEIGEEAESHHFPCASIFMMKK